METFDFPISSINQGMQCPLCNPGGGGVLQLWLIKTTDKFFLSCDECEASWEINEPIKNIRVKSFENFLDEAGLEFPKDNNKFQRVLDHTLFSVQPDEFNKLINEAWVSPKKVMRIPTEYDVEMERVLGFKGETKIRLLYNPYNRQIVDAYPIPSNFV